MGEDWATSFAYAKINLALAIVGKREDGYHELQSVLQSIALHDVVKVRRTERGIVCRCGELSGPQNLAYRAAAIFLRRLSILESKTKQRAYTRTSDSGLRTSDYGVEIEIEKNIPWQAGLGGGSSDAATTLKLLNEVFRQPFNYGELVEMAVQCGADVPFCLKGGTQWAGGIGEQLEILPPAPHLDLVLVKPPLGVDTGQAYRRFDQAGKLGNLSRVAWQRVLEDKDAPAIASLLHNDLEQISMEMVPAIGRIKRALMAAGCLGALMAGSGSAVFGIADSSRQAQAAAEKLRIRSLGQVWVTRMQN